MALSHFTIKSCPNCGHPDAIGMPERGDTGEWWCPNCGTHGTIDYHYDMAAGLPEDAEQE